MEIYKCSNVIIESWQYGHPALRNLSDCIGSLVDLRSGTALDVGCGTGRTSLMLAKRGLQVDAVDIEPKVIAIAQEIARKDKIKVNFSIFDFSQAAEFFIKPYDLVICSEVLEHAQNYKNIITNLYSCLSKDGILIVTVPHDQRQFSILDNHGGHLRRFTIPQLKEDLGKFKIIDCFTIGFPCMRTITYLHVLLLKIMGKNPSPEKYLKNNLLKNVFYSLIYYIFKIDNFFNRFNKGTNIICKLKK